MYDDLIIGNVGNSCSAVKCFQEGRLWISENGRAFWISGAVQPLDMHLKVAKKEPLGILIGELIDKDDGPGINRALAEVVFRQCDLDTLSRKLAQAMERAANEGRRAQAEVIRHALFPFGA